MLDNKGAGDLQPGDLAVVRTGRGRAHVELSIEPDPGLATHVLASLAQAGRLALHVDATGRDAHHTAEAAFKAVGRALRAAARLEGSGLPSTKGLL